MDPDYFVDSNRRGDEDQPAGRAIFREEARRHYIENEEKVELPAVVSPKIFVYLWIISLALMAVGLIVAFWPLIQQW